jgi:transposase
VTRSGRTEDPKGAALRETRCLNPHPEAVTDERFTSSDFFDARDLAQVKYEMVRAVREEDMPVTVAAGFGLSRQSYYQAAAALDQGGLPGLVPAKPGPRGAHKLTDEVCAFAEDALATDPGLRPTDLCDAIERAFGVRVHARSVERALARRRARRSKSG